MEATDAKTQMEAVVAELRSCPFWRRRRQRTESAASAAECRGTRAVLVLFACLLAILGLKLERLAKDSISLA